MNDNSSRSHSVLTITLSSETQDPEDPQVTHHTYVHMAHRARPEHSLSADMASWRL